MKPRPDPATAFDGVHPPMLGAGSVGGCKKVAVGQSIARALETAGLSQKDAAGRMGYSDQGTVSRWCAGIERPHFDKLFELPGFEAAWMRVRAAKHPKMRSVTVIEIREEVA